MRHHLIRVLALFAACMGICRATADPATGPDIPDAEISKIYQDAKDQPVDKKHRIEKNTSILATARKCLTDHPEVPPTAPMRELLVRRVMLPAAERIYQDDPSAVHRDQLRELASEVVRNPLLEGHLIVPEKVHAATTLARLDIFTGPDGAPVDAAKRIRALVASFPPLPAAKDPTAFTGQATVDAAQLAIEAKEPALADEYCKTIAEQYLAVENALTVLVQAGHAPVFKAEMTKLDGSRLRFPEDTMGRVVVLDFWATWCGPCVASMPHLKQLHQQYRDRGVLIIGVSCDTPTQKETPEENKAKVAGFVADKGFDWTHTYAGAWPEAAVRYGVSRIPTVFVLDKRGRIVSATARGREAQLIDQALATP